MQDVVNSAAFEDMPNAVSNGRINWQVSSGKSTSFYEYYLARWDWWERKADSLALPGRGNENERFTIAARIINPTGYRACRLCGEDWNVGYFYLNDRFYKKLKKIYSNGSFFKWQPIDSALHELRKRFDNDQIAALLNNFFPERQEFFNRYGYTKEAFERSSHINSKAWLTPGYMGNPPDRLDGFHDYHFECRKSNDPGRFEANMKTYNHDRRSFEYWAEGNWMLADTLYNLAGVGKCLDCPDGHETIKVSPDHIGPISCGFKQMAFFKPLCSTHNSSKNRRFTYYDTLLLRDKEKELGESVASFQIQKHWDIYKHKVKNDEDTKVLSNSLRSLQDAYFRTLMLLWEHGYVRFISTLLSPQFAFDEVKFDGLDPSNLTYSRFEISKKITPNRRSLFTRSIRVALSSLQEYVSKGVEGRKMLRKDFEINAMLVDGLIVEFNKLGFHELDLLWAEKLPSSILIDDSFENTISELTDSEEVIKLHIDKQRYDLLKACMDSMGQNADMMSLELN